MDMNNSSSSWNDTLVCHPILLAQGNKSQLGLCDDEISALVIASLVLVCHVFLLFTSLFGFIYKLHQLKKLEMNSTTKRNGQQVNFLTVARNPALMIIGALAGFIYNVVISGRVLIGRKNYPCFIYSLIYYLSVPIMASTIILRFIRLIVLSWLNNVKVRIAKREMILPTVIMKNKEIQMSEVTKSQETSLTSALVPSLENVTSDTAPQNHTITIPQQDSEEEIIFRKETFLESFEKGRLLNFLKFLVSSKFIFLFYGIVCFVHISIYLIIGGVDYYHFMNGIRSDNKRQSFMIDTFLFSTSGCGNGSYSTTLFITYLALYASFGVIFAIIALFMKRDVWFVKMEIVFTVINWVFFALLYGIPSLFTQVTTLVDYYVPVANSVEIACMMDTFISITLPVFVYQEIDKRRKKSLHIESSTTVSSSLSTQHDEYPNRIRKILTNEKWNSLFLQFSEKCFASEDILMWHAVEQFKKVTSEKLRIELFLKICDTYLRIGAPLELNIPRKEFGVPEIMDLYLSLRSSNRQISALTPMKDLSQSNTLTTIPKLGNSTVNTPHATDIPVVSNPTMKRLSVNALTTPANETHHANNPSQNGMYLSPSNVTTTTTTHAFSIPNDIFDRIQICCEHNLLDNFSRFELVYNDDLKSIL